MRHASWLIAAAVLAAATVGASAGEPPLILSLESLAKAGNAEAIYHLGMAHHTGSGVPQNFSKALSAFRKSAALGDPLASYKLGCYFDGQGFGLVTDDAKQALKYKLVAAEAGYALAQQDVGALYARSGDVEAGLAWLEKSASQGWSGALMTLASVHNGALGVERDAAKTAAYFRLFLDLSDPTDKQRAWLRRFEKGLTADDRKRAEEIVRSFRPTPTALTLRALSGQRAAQELIAQQR
jgi:uncharacterized protein